MSFTRAGPWMPARSTTRSRLCFGSPDSTASAMSATERTLGRRPRMRATRSAGTDMESSPPAVIIGSYDPSYKLIWMLLKALSFSGNLLGYCIKQQAHGATHGEGYFRVLDPRARGRDHDSGWPPQRCECALPGADRRAGPAPWLGRVGREELCALAQLEVRDRPGGGAGEGAGGASAGWPAAHCGGDGGRSAELRQGAGDEPHRRCGQRGLSPEHCALRDGEPRRGCRTRLPP